MKSKKQLICSLMYGVLFGVFQLTFSFQVSAQEELEEMSVSRTIILNSADSTISVDVRTTDAKLDQINAEAIYYWFSNNQIHSNRGGFDGQLLHGEYLVKSNSGKLIAKGFYKNGLKEEKWSRWYPNGNKKIEVLWKEGRQEGIVKKWNKDGKLTSSYQYKDDQKEGKYQLYHINGELAEKGKMKDGKKDGTVESYRENQSIESRIQYKNGEKDGWAKLYDDEGELDYKQRYEGGVLIPKIEKEQLPFKWKFWEKKTDENPTIRVKVKTEGA